MRRSWIAVCAAALAIGCGNEQERIASSAAELAACSEAALAWADSGSTTDSCSGGWQYYVASKPNDCYVNAPSTDCGVTYPQGKICNHAHVLGVSTADVPVSPVSKTVRECCYPNETNGYRCPKPPCETRVVWDYQAPCTAAANTLRNAIPNANLDLRTAITFKATVTSAPGDGEAGKCLITFTNWPTSWHWAVDGSRCAASTILGQDSEHPNLGTCRSPTKTICGAMADDAYKIVCTNTPNSKEPYPSTCGVEAPRYSGFNAAVSTLESAALGRGDPTYPPVCLTDEDKPLRSGGALAQDLVRAKFERLMARYWKATPTGDLKAHPAVLELRKALAAKLKLLLEQAGHLLTSEQRRQVIDIHFSMPEVQEACGTAWTLPNDASMTYATPWSDSLDGGLDKWAAEGVVTTGSDGSNTWAVLGSSASPTDHRALHAYQRFAPAGGTLSFRYKRACRGAPDWARVRVMDLYSGELAFPLAQSCSTDAAWQQMNWPIPQSMRGHRVVLSLESFDDGVAGTASQVLFDDVSFPSASMLPGPLQMCRRLSAGEGAPEAVEAGEGSLWSEWALADWCTWITHLAADLPADYPDRQTYVDAARDASAGAAQRAFTVLAGGDEGQRRPNLQRHLRTLGSWYGAASRPGVYPAGSVGTSGLWRDASQILGSLEMGLYKRDLDWLKGQTTKDDPALRDYLVRGFGRDRELLQALFSEYVPPAGASPVLPLTTAPALLVLADGFRPMHQRLGEMVGYHDYACRFLRCKETGLNTEVSYLHSILSALGDPDRLEKAANDAQLLANQLPSTERFSTDWPLWKAVFDQIVKKDAQGVRQHAKVVQPAVRSALGLAVTEPYLPSQVEGVSPTAAPPLVSLAGLVGEAGLRSRNYAATGLFSTDRANVLPIPLLKENGPLILGNARNRQVALSTAVDQYRGQRSRLVETLIGQVGTTGAADSAASKRQDIALRMTELSTDALGLKLRSTIESALLGQQGAAYTALLATLKDTLGQKYVTVTPIENWGLGVSGAEGRYTGSGPVLSVADVAVTRNGATKVLTAKAGQVVSIQATGTWAPTCALQASPSFGGLPIVGGATAPTIRDALTGPQGYTLAYSGGTFQTNSHTNAMSESWYHKEEACAGVKYELPLGDASGWSFGASIQACGGYSWSSTWSSQKTGGSDSRTMASFAMGLRLPNTPFPEAPAGSLLAVITPLGSPNARLDVQVIQAPFTTITFPEASDLYFVVNDAQCYGGRSSRTDRVRIDMTVAEPILAKMLELGAAMGETMTGLRTRAQSIVGQGRWMPNDTNLIRADAWATLKSKCACDLSPYPEVVRDYFGAWLEAEISRIDNALAELSSRREMEHLMLQAQVIDQELATLGDQGRLQDMLLLDTLRNLDIGNEYLRGASSQVARGAMEEIGPYVQIRYPEVLGFTSAAGNNENAQLRKLLRFDWEAGSLDALGDALRVANDAVLGRIDLEVPKYPVYSKPVLVRFPNERFVPPPLPFAGRTVTADRAGPLWATIRANQTVKFKIDLADLYRKQTGGGRLACNEQAPVVKAMALHFALPSCTGSPCATYNAQRWDADTVIGEMMDFPGSASGERVYVYSNPATLLPTTRFIYGEEAQALTTFDALRASAPDFYSATVKGVSPFTTFEVAPFDGLAEPSNNTTSMSVILDVETRTAGANVVECP